MINELNCRLEQYILHSASANKQFYPSFMGLLFKSRLIIAQMSSTRAQLVNKLLVVYALVASCALSGLLDARELLVLRVFAVFSTLAHVHFGVCVVCLTINFTSH